jgi:hypothetical protein
MAKRTYYYVNDHGEIFRMTEARYHRYLLAGTREDKFPDAGEYGVYIGYALSVKNFAPEEFLEEYKALSSRLACRTCLGNGRIRDGKTKEQRRCLDCSGTGVAP